MVTSFKSLFGFFNKKAVPEVDEVATPQKPPKNKKKNKPTPPPQSGIVEHSDDEHTYKFAYRVPKEMRRAQRLFEKEPGTIEWLKTSLQPGDVYYDVGTNIGAYAIFAGKRVGKTGHVFAFEPHIPNAASFMENVFLNNIAEWTTLVTMPLNDEQKYDFFNYQSVIASTSTSQFGRHESEGREFKSVFSELKFGATLDSLVSKGLIRPPDLVKIDVDGLDSEVLAGMVELMGTKDRPRSVQVEMGSESKKEMTGQFEEAGYKLMKKHWTQAGQNHINAGNDPESVPYNAIFEWPEASPAR